MNPRLLQVGHGQRRLAVVIFHLTAAYDAKIRAALGPEFLVANVTLAAGAGLYSEAKLPPLQTLADKLTRLVGAPVDIAVLVGFSEGCQALRTCLLRSEAPPALVACDGTHGSWPTRAEARELAPWRARFEAALEGRGLFVASHSGLTYVESLKPTKDQPGLRPYASTWRVLREVTGWPLDVPKAGPKPVVSEEANAAIYSTDAPDHVAQARDVLPRMLQERVLPYLDELRALQAAEDSAWGGSPAPSSPLPPPPSAPPPAAGERLPAVKTPLAMADLCAALASVWGAIAGQPPTRAAVDLCAAHIGLETGQGKSVWCWNLGNVKAGSSWSGDVTHFACNEIMTAAQAKGYVARARPRTDGKPGLDAAITSTRADGTVIVWFYPDNGGCKFRGFKTLAEGVADHLNLLKNHKRFKTAWPFLLAGDVRSFVHALKMASYFTADEGPYLTGVSGVLKSVQKLSYPMPAPAVAEASACTDGLCDEERASVEACVERSDDEGDVERACQSGLDEAVG